MMTNRACGGPLPIVQECCSIAESMESSQGTNRPGMLVLRRPNAWVHGAFSGDQEWCGRACLICLSDLVQRILRAFLVSRLHRHRRLRRTHAMAPSVPSWRLLRLPLGAWNLPGMRRHERVVPRDRYDGPHRR